jgi:hypothetical protein
MSQFATIPIDLEATAAHSPAPVAKAYLRRMGVAARLTAQPDFTALILGYAMFEFFCGRAEVQPPPHSVTGSGGGFHQHVSRGRHSAGQLAPASRQSMSLRRSGSCSMRSPSVTVSGPSGGATLWRSSRSFPMATLSLCAPTMHPRTEASGSSRCTPDSRCGTPCPT